MKDAIDSSPVDVDMLEDLVENFRENKTEKAHGAQIQSMRHFLDDAFGLFVGCRFIRTGADRLLQC